MGSSAPLVRWRQAGCDPKSVSALTSAPAQNLGFVEALDYVFEKPASGWCLRIDDEPLEDVRGDPTLWAWSPGFFAGEVTAELFGPLGSPSMLFLLDVAPDLTKIGRKVFDQMIAELWTEDPSLVVGSEPGTATIGELGDSQNPWLEFARLRRHVPEFLRGMAAVRARPRRALQVRRSLEPLHHVRRVDRHTAVALANSPAVAVLFADTAHEPVLLPDSRLDVPVVEETLDSAANRAMLALLLALARRTRSLLERLDALVFSEKQSDTRTPLRTRWPVRKQFLEQLAIRLKMIVRETPFSAVRRAELTAAGLNAIAADPTYARAWSQGWRALRHGMESGERLERLWISPSWEIYERWCFVRVGKLLASAMPHWGWRRLKNPDRWSGSYGQLHGDLHLQPKFAANSPSAAGLWSVSKERVPDIVLTVRGPEVLRFVVIDAKYRASRGNVLDAMESAHIYQDSLRIGAQRPEASLLLIPSGGGATWLEDTAFQAQHRVGAFVLSPEAGPSLPPLVADLLGY